MSRWHWPQASREGKMRELVDAFAFAAHIDAEISMERLMREYDGLWCISELCPFNGVFCMFGRIGATLSCSTVTKMADWEF